MIEKVAMIGESMLELSRDSTRQVCGKLPMNMSYGGDTLNSAVYLARQGIAVDYVTALGDDHLSAWMVDQWREEGLGCDLIDYYPDAVPGLYLIETDDQGERSFYYWRDQAPARRLFDEEEQVTRLKMLLAEHAWICVSGITLAIYSESSRQRLYNLLENHRRQGGKVMFDGNYRPKLWPSRGLSQNAYESMYRLTDMALPTVEDEQQLFGDADETDIIRRIQSWGVREIALKMGEHGCRVAVNVMQEVVPSRQVEVIDATSAGDSFNAGYLAARIKGYSPREAALAGHRLAAVVIQHKGAIIPASAMPKDE